MFFEINQMRSTKQFHWMKKIFFLALSQTQQHVPVCHENLTKRTEFSLIPLFCITDRYLWYRQHKLQASLNSWSLKLARVRRIVNFTRHFIPHSVLGLLFESLAISGRSFWGWWWPVCGELLVYTSTASLKLTSSRRTSRVEKKGIELKKMTVSAVEARFTT